MEEHLFAYREIYTTFRATQAKFYNRPFRLPKDGDVFWDTKLKKEQRETIRKMHRYLHTTGQDVDLPLYFSCGFELGKSFSYHQGFYKQVIQLYIQKSKINKKVEVELKRSLINSAKFVKEYCSAHDIDSLSKYATKRQGAKLVCIEHFLKNNICKGFLAFLIHRKYASLIKEDWVKLEELNENFEEFRRGLREIKYFTDKMEQIL